MIGVNDGATSYSLRLPNGCNPTRDVMTRAEQMMAASEIDGALERALDRFFCRGKTHRRQ
jgi:hypothetical protein